jgi:hypothetical protein
VVFVLIAQTLNIICACGCGNQLEPTDRFGRPHKFIRGHNGSRRGQPGMFGKDNPNWKGGITINWSGYILSKTGYRKYTRQHRLIYEEYYNCCLLPWSHIYIISMVTNRITE